LSLISLERQGYDEKLFSGMKGINFFLDMIRDLIQYLG